MANKRTHTESARSLVLRGLIRYMVAVLSEQSDRPTTQRVLRTVSRGLSIFTEKARGNSLTALTPAEYAEAVTWLAEQFNWDIHYRLAGDHIRFTSTNCLDGERAPDKESFCRLWCESLERIADDIFGYGKVVFKRRMAMGEKYCDFRVFVKNTAETDIEENTAYPSTAHHRPPPKGDTEHLPEELVPQLKTKVRLLERRARKLEKVLEERKLIDKAKRILMERLRLPEPEAMRKLQLESQHRNIKLAEVAQIIVRAGEII